MKARQTVRYLSIIDEQRVISSYCDASEREKTILKLGGKYVHFEQIVEGRKGSRSNPCILNRMQLNPVGPLGLCVCKGCHRPIMLDDKEKRIRVGVPNILGMEERNLAAIYHAFFNPSPTDMFPKPFAQPCLWPG